MTRTEINALKKSESGRELGTSHFGASDEFYNIATEGCTVQSADIPGHQIIAVFCTFHANISC